jgi:hypothetical protein
MPSRTFAPALLGALLLVSGCDSPEPAAPASETPLFAGVPANGNENKLVVPVNDEFLAECDGEELTVNITGWFQARLFPQPSNPNVELDVFHLLWTFTNSTGETFTFHDIGPNHISFDFDTEEFILDLTGRISGGVIGHLRINLTTGETEFVAGKVFGDLTALACEALT